jgi:paxillin
MVHAMGKNWHPQCFNCHECHVPLGPDNFKEKNGKPYCLNDYNKLFKPRCAGCDQPILVSFRLIQRFSLFLVTIK